jgi:hypothetical protein
MIWLNSMANFLGILGVFFVLLAYLLLQIGKMKATWICYSLLNTVGSLLILISLYFYWNLASGIIEIAWFIISLYGLLKSIYLRTRREAHLKKL